MCIWIMKTSSESQMLYMTMFCAGGWVGYFSYDTVRYVEKKKLPFSSTPVDDRNLPDVHLGLYNDVVVFDHVEKVCISRYTHLWGISTLCG